MVNYYDVLGVAKNASAEEIKVAYKKLAKKYHPDINKGNKEYEQKFQEISEAYNTLKDDNSRRMYDSGGMNSSGAGGFGGGFGGGGFDFNDIFSQMDDIFGGGFGSQGRAKQNVAGRDLLYQMSVSLKTAYFGSEEEITIESLVSCDSCNGSGAKNNSGEVTCSMCNGAGATITRNGFMQIKRSCNNCQGSGKVIKDKCSKCRGEGRYHSKSKLKIKVPAGVDNDSKLLVRGKGEAGFRGAGNGDLYVQISVAKDKYFIREGSTIIANVSVPLNIALLGGSIQVELVSGDKIKVEVPEGSVHGSVIKCKNLGMPILGRSILGDFHIKVNVAFPDKLSKKDKSTLREILANSSQSAYIISNR